MNLSELPLGAVATVTRVGGAGSFRRRLMELGLVPGTRVEVRGIAPLGDPLELLVRGASLSIRRSEALSVEVTVLPESQPVSHLVGPERARELVTTGCARGTP